MILVWATISSRKRDFPKFNVSQIAEKEIGVLAMFRFIFVLVVPMRSLST